MGKWKTVAKGVAVAAVGAGLIGAVHYMFIAPSVAMPDVMGIPAAALLPIVIGAICIAAPTLTHKVNGTVADVLTMGGAAAIGYGIATYAGWIMPKPAAARAYVAPSLSVRPVPAFASAGATKII